MNFHSISHTFLPLLWLLLSPVWAHGNAPKSHWVDIWTAMPQLTEPANLPLPPFNTSENVFYNTTLRQTIRLPLNTDVIRLRLSNAFGGTELSVTNVSIAVTLDHQLGTSAINPKTVTEVLFDGNSGITIPNGALAVSDPIKFPGRAQQTVTIDIYLASGQQGSAITSHPGSRTTSWMAFGNWIGAANITDSSIAHVDHWYFISAVEALLPQQARSCAIIGDSITDGRGSDTNENNRWPDTLQLRLHGHQPTSAVALLNQAAGGNRILADGLGPNVLSRLDRDVLAHSAVEYAIIFEGVNDIGVAAADPASQKEIGDRLIVAYKQIVSRLHAADILVYGATITPFGTPAGSAYTQPYSGPEREKTRQRLNKFIRESGLFDAVLDFDAVLRDPADPSSLLTEFDSGDHLHPNVKAYRTLGESIPLKLFE